MSDSARAEQDLRRFQAQISQYEGDQDSDVQGANTEVAKRWNGAEERDQNEVKNAESDAVLGGGTSKQEIE